MAMNNLASDQLTQMSKVALGNGDGENKTMIPPLLVTGFIAFLVFIQMNWGWIYDVISGL